MKTKRLLQTILAVAIAGAFVAGSPTGLAQVTDEDGFYFWRLGHMEGPHDSSKALGISRDGETAVGSTLVVDFWRAWRMDIDWAIATDDGVPPLYNELKVQEDIGFIAPSQPSAAFASSDMTADPAGYDLSNLQLDWGGSRPVGTIMGGTVSYGIEWLFPVLDGWVATDYVKIPDFGGGIADMEMKDVSANGLIAVGFGNNKKGPVAFRADLTDPLLPVVKTLTITDSVYTAQTLQWTRAEAVSADGMIIAGYGGTKTGNRAFVTTVLDASTDPITLVSVVLPNIAGGRFAEAYALTEMTQTAEDGTVTVTGYVIAGRSDSPKGPQACIWFIDSTTGLWVVKPLGGLSKKKLDSVAYGIAYRPGSLVGDLIVVGRSASILYPTEAFVWTGNPVLVDDLVGYMYDLEYILTKTGVAEACGMGSEWILQEATGVSFGADGTRIVGWGTNPEGGMEAFLVTGFPFDELVFIKE
jgi:hypothetical protein